MHIGIDPGKWKMGIAAVDGDVAIAAVVRVPRGTWTETAAVNAVLDGLQALRKRGVSLHHAHIHIEKPMHYGGAKAALQRDVVALEELSLRLRAELHPLGYKVSLYTPHGWKGNVPKPVHHRRVRRALSPAGRRTIEAVDYGDAQADVWDALGLALFGAGQLGRGGRR
tara:strand:- start:754 stop:1257 length:504 start_codon:yes stop_codon:yes gene_type:complete